MSSIALYQSRIAILERLKSFENSLEIKLTTSTILYYRFLMILRIKYFSLSLFV